MVKNQLLHRERINPENGEPCTWTDWVRIASPWGYATTFAAARDVEELKDIPMNELAQVPEKNFPTLKKLSTQVRAQPSVLLAAKTKSADDFIRHVNREHPGQHLELPKMIRFVVTESEYTIVEEVIKAEMEKGSMTRTQVLVSLFMDRWIEMSRTELSK